MFITYTINAPSAVFLLCCWRDEIVDEAPAVDGKEDDDATGAGLGSLVMVVDFFAFFLVVVMILALVLVLVSSAVKAVNSLLSNKLIFRTMRAFLDGGGTTLSSGVPSPDF